MNASKTLCQHLRRIRFVWKFRKSAEGFAGFLASCLFLMFFAFILDNVFQLSEEVRDVITLFVCVVSALCLLKWALAPLVARKPLEAVALMIETRKPELENVLINALQLSQRTDAEDNPFIQVLVERAGTEVAALRKQGRLVEARNLWRNFMALGFALCVWIAYGTVFPVQGEHALRRYTSPGERILSSRFENVQVRPGDCKVLEGASVRVQGGPETYPATAVPSWKRLC